MYSECHDYKYIHQTESLNERWEPNWSKIYLIKQLLQNNCSMVLWIDYDAAFVNCSLKIEDFLQSQRVKESEMFVFSADTNIINSGVMLFRHSEWTSIFIDEIIDIGPTPNLGMGTDNTALAIRLVGCKANADRNQREYCYKLSDFANLEPKNSLIRVGLSAGNQSLINTVIDPSLQPFIHLVPQSEFNSYKLKRAKFIAHFPNTFSSTREKLISRALISKGRKPRCVCKR